ncbi:reverse transcriptase [Prevotella copri]|mgnify:FL=1|jgi:hypothetical protein|uniref:reverse transcriptase domain-containing protein n=1 Tax=Segatella copri TaxID=165179 RepID=UPI001933C22C|nr:reverse transcriptase domain-containing protein [Segatella copri]MBM0265661.1 reverse transcriptase [Segatella copri]
MIDFSILLEAYFDCRRHKRKTVGATEFEMNYMSNLVQLLDEINSRQYKIGKSICFVVRYPRYREVFAGQFRDRIIHHYIALRLEPLFESLFSDRTYNCRKGKGQLAGIRQLQEDIMEVSENYTEDAYVMGIDLKGFFMSIYKPLLAKMVDDFVARNYHGDDKDDLRWLCNMVVMHHPEKDCEKKSADYLWEFLPKEKSLFTNGEDRGVAIGNLFAQLFAQLFANFLLSKLDWKIDYYCKHHVRYVDDMVLVARRKETLLRLMPMIRETLASLGLRLNEKKFYFQHYSKGVRFVGAIIKRDRIYSVNNTINNFRKSVRKLNDAARNGDIEAINHAIQSVNSYLGIFGHYNEYGMKRQIIKEELDEEAWKFFVIKGHYRSVQLKKRYNIDMKYKNMANEILNHKTEERKDIPTENEISKMLDEGYELEMYIIDGRIHVECYPRDS